MNREERFKKHGPTSNRTAEFLSEALNLRYGKKISEVIPADPSSGAVVVFPECSGLVLEAMLDPADKSTRFLALIDGEPIKTFNSSSELDSLFAQAQCFRRRS